MGSFPGSKGTALKISRAEWPFRRRKHGGGADTINPMCLECKRLRDKCERLAQRVESIKLAEEISKVSPHLYNGPTEGEMQQLQTQRRVWIYRLREHLRVEKHFGEAAGGIVTMI
jgi:hypothetical protein